MFKLNKIFNSLNLPTCVFTVWIVSLLFSCKSLVSVDAPKDQLILATVFTNDKTAVSAISGLYSQMATGGNLAGTGMTLFPGLTADEIYNTTSNVYDELSKNIISSSNAAIIGSFWTPAYNYIYQVNSIIEGINSSSTISENVKNQLLGESKFIRAFVYFYLVNLFGDVPLITITNYRENLASPRTNREIVYQQILSDLLDAQALLSEEYPSVGRVRPNRFTVETLLARVYLYNQDYERAKIEATKVIQSEFYNLVPLNEVFLKDSKEAIWQLMPPVNSNTSYPTLFFPASSVQIPLYNITSSLLNAFEEEDHRKSVWTRTEIRNSVEYQYPYKYQVKTGTGVPVSEYNVVFRLGELYLIRAECYAHQGEISKALEDLDSIRNRAGVTLLKNTKPEIDQVDLIEVIEKERRIEFFSEWGHRWLDLKRTNRINAVLSIEKGNNWQPTDALFPIPAGQLIANPLLTQNPGYN